MRAATLDRSTEPVGVASRSGDRARSSVVALIGVCAIVAYAIAALAVTAEGDPGMLVRVVSVLAVLTVAATIAGAIRSGGRVAGAAMFVTGVAAVPVLMAVVGSRLATGIDVRDVLGVIAVAAAVVLFVLGSATLVSRIAIRWLRPVVAVVATLVVAQFVWLPVGAAVVATHRARPTATDATPADQGLAFADVRITADDGVGLGAWWIASRNGAAVVMLPGSGSTRDDVLDEAAFVARHGYGVLVMDARGHGVSGGRPMEFGWGHERDVRSAITWVLARPQIEHVGLFGLSMGGEVALTTAALDPRVDAVVAEGASARTWDDAALEPEPHPVGLANTWLTFVVADLLTPASPPAPLIDLVRAIDAPTLLIAGSPANERELDRLYADAAPGSVELWEIPSSPHVGGLTTEPREYPARVLAHLDDGLLPDTAAT